MIKGINHFRFYFLIPVLLAIIFSGCAAKGKINTQPTKPVDPIVQLKNNFTDSYGFYITDDKKVAYYQESLGVTDKEKNIFKNLKTVEELNKFVEIFWKVRDTDPNTSENEFKADVDKRIDEIQNEVLSANGVQFKAYGGSRSDLARVYLLRGAPHRIERYQSMSRVSDLMVWAYFDYKQNPLFIFLFYDKGFGYKIFKRYDGMNTPEMYMERLREVARFYPTSPDEYMEIENEIMENDHERFLWFALIYNQFSYYSDIVIEGGDVRKKRFGALDPPEPAMLTAARFKPIVIGQPNVPKDEEMIYGSRKSFIPGRIGLGKNEQTGKYSLSARIKYSDMDWGVKRDPNGDATNDKVASFLILTVSFQNFETKERYEFVSGVNLTNLKSNYDRNPDGSFRAYFDDLNNYTSGKPAEKLSEMLNQLKPGSYLVDFSLRHSVTKKSLVWLGTVVIE